MSVCAKTRLAPAKWAANGIPLQQRGARVGMEQSGVPHVRSSHVRPAHGATTPACSPAPGLAALGGRDSDPSRPSSRTAALQCAGSPPATKYRCLTPPGAELGAGDHLLGSAGWETAAQAAPGCTPWFHVATLLSFSWVRRSSGISEGSSTWSPFWGAGFACGHCCLAARWKPFQ